MHLSNPLLSSTLLLLSLTNPTQSAYTLKDDYTPSTFFSQFTFFTDTDPTNGYVDYISQSAASSAGLINTNNNQIYMGVDSTNVASGRGRKSVRLTSKAVYNHALIILDLDHMPGSICGVWPAFWTVGPNWPTSGEIDIIEGVNGQVGNSMALHTGPGCSVSGSSSGSSNTSPNTGSAQALFSGTIKTPDCNTAAAGQPTNAGCAITTSDASTYGSGLNSANGGVYATEWTSDVIRVWFFPRGQIPSDIDSGSPSPSSWGAPLSSFGGGSCNIDSSFRDQQIVFDTTFCGDWAGSVWSSDAMCSGKASTCQEYVQNNPAAFGDAYWAVNHLKVYTGGESGGVAPSAVPSVSQSVGVSASMSMSRPVGTGLPSSQAPIGSALPSTTPGFGTGAPKPVPVPTGASMSTSATATATGMGQPQPQPQPTAATSPFAPSIATSQTQAQAPAPSQSQSQVPANSNPNPYTTAPLNPPVPTTMATSRTNNWGGNGNTWGNGGYTRTRSWNGPPRMGKWAGQFGAGDVAVNAAVDAAINPWQPVAPSGMPDSGSVDANAAGTGGYANTNTNAGADTSVYDGAVRSLIRPVVRKRDEEEVMVRRDGKRSHLGRHKERRWGHDHGYGRAMQ